MTIDKPTQKRPSFDPVRAAAFSALLKIVEGAQIDNALKEVSRNHQFSSLDRRFMQQLVSGTTKMRLRLDHEIKFYLARPSQKLSDKLAEILRLGFYQIIFLTKVPHAAAVSESVNLAKRFLDQKQAQLVNAVMRAYLRQPEKVHFPDKKDDTANYFSKFYSFPLYYVEYCIKEFGVDEAEKLLQGQNAPPRVTYRINFLKTKPDEIANKLQSHGVEFSFGKYLPEFIHIHSGGLPLEEELLRTGKVFVQDESAGLPVRLLNPKPSSDVLDLASAPGGKSTYAAIRMRNKGMITSVDKSNSRLRLVSENARRLGIKIISPVACDALKFESKPFGRVLLDPPCSGWGTAGKLADLRWAKTSEDIDNLAIMQANMIDHAATLVRPGGILVYSTCTLIRQENDQVVEEFLLRNNEFEIDPADQFVDKSIASERGYVKTYPNIENLDGSFCARLRRKLPV